jgi:hypothetical protein
MSRHHDVNESRVMADPHPVPTGSDTLVAGASVDQSPITWDVLVRAMRHYANGGEHTEKIAALLAEIMPGFLDSPDFSKYFRVWESSGFHVTRVHFYSPIPNTAELTDDIWKQESAMAGIDMNDRGQMKLLAACKRFQDEYNILPQEPTDAPEQFYLRNPMFGGTDALVLYCLVRHFRPRSVIEVGSGFSTRLFVEAAKRNGPTDISCIEPYPDPILKQGSLPVTLIERRVQDVSLSTFDRLESGDFLFIDSSHVLKIGGDVSHLLLEVLPTSFCRASYRRNGSSINSGSGASRICCRRFWHSTARSKCSCRTRIFNYATRRCSAKSFRDLNGGVAEASGFGAGGKASTRR